MRGDSPRETVGVVKISAELQLVIDDAQNAPIHSLNRSQVLILLVVQEFEAAITVLEKRIQDLESENRRAVARIPTVGGRT